MPFARDKILIPIPKNKAAKKFPLMYSHADFTPSFIKIFTAVKLILLIESISSW